jgi:hypothetical protein
VSRLRSRHTGGSPQTRPLTGPAWSSKSSSKPKSPISSSGSGHGLVMEGQIAPSLVAALPWDAGIVNRRPGPRRHIAVWRQLGLLCTVPWFKHGAPRHPPFQPSADEGPTYPACSGPLVVSERWASSQGPSFFLLGASPPLTLPPPPPDWAHATRYRSQVTGHTQQATREE